MGRRPNPQRKQDLLDEIIRYLGEHGIGELSLRPLASELETSTYTLTYQFGSKDGLLLDAVRFVEDRQFTEIRSWLEEDPDQSAATLLRRNWVWSTDDDNLKLVRLLIEATTLGRSQPDVFGDVGTRVVGTWNEFLTRQLVAGGMSDVEAAPFATSIYATVMGLQFDLIATGDLDRVGDAYEQLCISIEARVPDRAAA